MIQSFADVEKALAVLEEDLAAFRREHAGHSHELRPFATHTLAPTPGVHAPRTMRTSDHGLLPDGNVDPALVDPIVQELRRQSEARAWKAIEAWCDSVRDHSSPHVRLWKQVGRQDESGASAPEYGAELWHRHTEIARKYGTSRVDALAHLAAWCQAEMGETAADREFGR